MQDMVKKDICFKRQEVPLVKAIEYFQKEKADDKVRLLRHRQKDYLTIYQLGNLHDYHHGYMVPSTGYLKWFALDPAGDGFSLRFPRKNSPTKLQPLPDYPKLISSFRQYGDWLDRNMHLKRWLVK
jgi:uridine kinase